MAQQSVTLNNQPPTPKLEIVKDALLRCYGLAYFPRYSQDHSVLYLINRSI